MTKWLAIAVYRCEIAGEPSRSLDFQVRAFDASTVEQVESALRSEQPHQYFNSDKDAVVWSLSEIIQIEELAAFEGGDELIGFIAETSTIDSWASPPPI